MSDEPKKPTSAKSECLIAAAVTLGITIAAIVGGLLFVKRTLSRFDARRGQMYLRDGLVVTDEHLRYSPGIDGVMWSKFTVKAKGLDEVFDTAKVDSSEFSRKDYEFRVDWINDD